METLRESFLHLTFQMSTYKRATMDEEDLVDSSGDDIYPSSPMQVNMQIPCAKRNKWLLSVLFYYTVQRRMCQPSHFMTESSDIIKSLL